MVAEAVAERMVALLDARSSPAVAEEICRCGSAMRYCNIDMRNNEKMRGKAGEIRGCESESEILPHYTDCFLQRGEFYVDRSRSTCLWIEYEHLDGLDSIPGTRSTNRKLGNIDAGTATFPSYQYLSKPLDGNGRVAVLLINSSAEATKLTATFSDIPQVCCNPCKKRNIWKHQDEGEYHKFVVGHCRKSRCRIHCCRMINRIFSYAMRRLI